MGLLDFLPDINPNPQAMGLLGMGAAMLNASNNQRVPVSLGSVFGAGMGGLTDGLQGYYQQEQQRKAMEMQQKQYELQNRKMEREIRKDEALAGIDINDPNAISKLLQAGDVSSAVALYKAMNPSKSVDPYFQAISTPKGIASFDARTGKLTMAQDENGNGYMKAPDDPNNRGAIKYAEQINTIKNQTLPDGREVPMLNGNAISNNGPISPGIPQQNIVTQGNTTFAFKNPQQAMQDLQQLPEIQQAQALYNQRNGIGQSTAEKERQKEMGKATAESAASLNSRLAMYDDIISEMDKGMNALSPVTDKLTGKTVKFGIETGGMFPGARAFWNENIVNDPKLANIETAAAMGKLKDAQTYLKGQGSVSDAERVLLGEAVGIDPYKQTSADNYERFKRMKEKAEMAKKAILNQAKGDFSAIQQPQSIDDLVNHYTGGK